MCNQGFISLHGGTVCQQILHPSIVVTLHGSVDSFSETSERRKAFLSFLVTKLSLFHLFEPIIVAVRPGSVIVHLVFYEHISSMLTVTEVVMRLRVSFRSGELESIGVTGLIIGDEVVSQEDHTVFSLLAIVMTSTLSFMMICIFGLLVIKRRRDANKIIPFFSDKDSVDSKCDASAVSFDSEHTPSPLKNDSTHLVATASSLDLPPGAAFRRVLTRNEDNLSVEHAKYDTKSVSIGTGLHFHGLPSEALKYQKE
jgi:hypothetical protein